MKTSSLSLVVLYLALANAFVDWSQVELSGAVPGERAHAGCAEYQNEYGFMAGGMRVDYIHFSTSPRYNDLWVFDSNDESWTNITTTGDIPSPRGGSVLVNIGDSLFLHGGGFFLFDQFFTHDFSDELFEYKILTNTWVKKNVTGTKPSGRIFHCGVAKNGELHIIGGLDNDLAALNEHWKYDPSANTWTQITNDPAPEGRNDFACFNRAIGILIAGGQTFPQPLSPVPNDETWRWNSLTGWNQLHDLPLPLNGMQFTNLFGLPFIQGGDTTAPDVIPPNFLPRKNVQSATLYFNGLKWKYLNTAHSGPKLEYGCMFSLQGAGYVVAGYDVEYDFSDLPNITANQTFNQNVYKLSGTGPFP